jgi:lantibiotic transport system permease protein
MEYLRACWSELLKIRRTWAFTLSVVTPVGVNLFIFLAVMEVQKRQWNDVWIYYLRGVVWSWLLLMTPLYVALLLALLASTDHTAGAWKLLLAQPVSRSPLYVAKLTIALLLVACSQLVLAVTCLGFGFLLPMLRPELGNYNPGVDVRHFLAMLSLGYVAGILMMAIHTWLSMKSANFALSLGVVIFAETANVLGMHQESLQKYWPWLFPFDAVRLVGLQPRDTVQHFWSIQHLISVSTVGAAAVTAVALWDFSRRQVT